MILIKKHTYIELSNILLGKNVHFKSDCEFFPNFDVIAKVISCEFAKNGEFILKCKANGKNITIDTNMKNLRYELI